MDEFGSTTTGETGPVPAPLRSLFNHPDDVRVQHLPSHLPGLDSLAVHFAAGARTVPHRHHGGQHLVFVEGVGVVGDEDGVHVVRAGDVVSELASSPFNAAAANAADERQRGGLVSNPPGAWHWHGATPGAAATHVTFEAPGDFDTDVERGDWESTYDDDLGW